MKDNQAEEDGEPCFPTGPDIYVDRIYFQYLPEGFMIQFGADHVGQIWRKDDEPGKWFYTYRNRYYAGPNSDPFDGGDRKRWSEVTFGGPDALENARSLVSAIRKAATIASLGAPIPDLETLVIEGYEEKLQNIIMTNPPSWLHAKIITK